MRNAGSITKVTVGVTENITTCSFITTLALPDLHFVLNISLLNS